MNANDTISDAQLQKIKERISKQVNPKEALKLLSDSKVLQLTMQKAADNFKTQVGRNVTYSEMREMMG